jgi:hypothetical protein
MLLSKIWVVFVCDIHCAVCFVLEVCQYTCGSISFRFVIITNCRIIILNSKFCCSSFVNFTALTAVALRQLTVISVFSLNKRLHWNKETL